MNPKPESPADFRDNMVEKLIAEGFITDSRVEQAMRTVPRHRFGHWLSLETVHARGAHPVCHQRRRWLIPDSRNRSWQVQCRYGLAWTA